MNSLVSSGWQLVHFPFDRDHHQVFVQIILNVVSISQLFPYYSVRSLGGGGGGGGDGGDGAEEKEEEKVEEEEAPAGGGGLFGDDGGDGGDY